MHKKSLEAQETLNGPGGKDSHSSDLSDEEKSPKQLSTSMESLNVVSPTPSPKDYSGYSGFADTETFRYECF